MRRKPRPFSKMKFATNALDLFTAWKVSKYGAFSGP